MSWSSWEPSDESVVITQRNIPPRTQMEVTNISDQKWGALIRSAVTDVVWPKTGIPFHKQGWQKTLATSCTSTDRSPPALPSGWTASQDW